MVNKEIVSYSSRIGGLIVGGAFTELGGKVSSINSTLSSLSSGVVLSLWIIRKKSKQCKAMDRKKLKTIDLS